MALIKLKRPATLNKFVNLACLSEKGEDEQVDFLDFISCIFSHGHATLHLAVSVGRSVGRSVDRSHF